MNTSRSRPKPWRHLLGSGVALAIAIPFWIYVLWWTQPDFIIDPNTSMAQRTLGWLGIPILVVAILTTGYWRHASAQARKVEAAVATQPGEPPNANPGERARREYVLEIIGLGVTLDKYRQGRLWEALRQGHPFASIREQDPKKYPWTGDDKAGQEGGRAGSSVENGIGRLPMYWPAPSFYADSAALDPANRGQSADSPVAGLAAEAESSGLDWTLFVSAGWMLSEHPDRLLEQAFDFFDRHPDVPYMMVSAADGLYFRDLYRPKGTEPLIKDGYYIPSMPDSSALFVLARRERIEPLRPFAFEDTSEDKLGPEQNQKGIARRVFLAHSALSKRLPRPEGSAYRNPTAAEWLAESERLAQRAEFQPAGRISSFTDRLGPFSGVVHVPPGFKPTPWFPVPWNKKQLSDFDSLPTLGYLHRPTYIKLTDKDGRPLQRRDERAKALLDGWQQALLTLPEDQRRSALKRIVASTGGDTDKMIALDALMKAQAAAGGPELDPAAPSQWVNTDARLGNTGAATWFVEMGIGVLASHLDGGVSAAINLRNDREASVIFISPPPEDQRQRQNRSNVLKNNTTPAIDPANYRQP